MIQNKRIKYSSLTDLLVIFKKINYTLLFILFFSTAYAQEDNEVKMYTGKQLTDIGFVHTGGNYYYVKATGLIKNNKKTGEWVLEWVDGRTEKGQFKNDLRTGVWKEFSRKTDTLIGKGNYLNGEKSGIWESYHYKTGEVISKCSYKNGLRNGKWERYDENGKIKSIENFSDDKRSGSCKYYYDNGELKEITNYSNGKMNGNCISYYPNRNIKLDRYYKNGKLHGNYKYYFQNGQFQSVGKYSNGFMVGEWKTYYENGNLRVKSYYDTNKNIGKIAHYYENGHMEMEGERVNRLKEGNWNFYSKNGNLIKSECYKEGIQNGAFSTYYESGKLKTQGNYSGQYKKIGEYKTYYESGQLQSICCLDKNSSKTGKSETYYESGQLKTTANYIRGMKTDTVTKYHSNGSIYKIEKWNLGNLISILTCTDGNGNNLYPGSLKNGEGIVIEYDINGHITKFIEYEYGRIKINRQEETNIIEGDTFLYDFFEEGFELNDDNNFRKKSRIIYFVSGTVLVLAFAFLFRHFRKKKHAKNKQLTK